jgi:cytochrome P450
MATAHVATRPGWAGIPATDELRHPSTRDLAHVGGKRGLPLVGTMPEILLDPMRFSQRMLERHGPIYRFHAMGKWHVHAAGPEAHERLLFDAGAAFSARGGWGPLVEPLLPGALLVHDGTEHRSRRRILGEAFKGAQLDGYEGTFRRDIERHVQAWTGRTIDAFRAMRLLSFEIAASTFIGLPPEADSETPLRWFGKVADGLVSIAYDPRFSPSRQAALRAKERLERYLTILIEERRRRPGTDFLSRMSVQSNEDGRPLPVQRILDTFVFLLVAAHDTMSSALTSSVHFLASRPDWAERLRAELLQAGVEDGAGVTEARLPLMDMFYKEAMRIQPPAPVIWRRTLREVEVMGHRLPAGTMAGVNLMLSHRLPDVWDRPDDFDPTRFAPEREQRRHRFAYAPFGAGVHKCLGMHFSQRQARALMAHLLLTTRIETVSGAAPRWYAWPSWRPRGRLALRVAPRSPGS